MRKMVLWGFVAGAALLVLLATLGARAGFVSMPFERLDGVSPWLTSRAAGITAYVALAIEIVFGLFLSTGAADRWIARAQSMEIHRFLSVAALALVATHALVLVADRFVRFDLLDVLVPFVAPHRRFATGIGVLAFWGAIVVHVSFGLRRNIGQRVWRALHYLSFAVFALATGHGLLAGTDAARPWMRAVYVSFTGVVLALVAARLVIVGRRAPG